MQLSDIFSIAACFALAKALPTANIPLDKIDVTFHGAADAQYTLSVPLDGVAHNTNNVLSISSVSSSYNIGQFCTLNTVDYPPALVEGPPGTWVVGPPQTVTSISCRMDGGGPNPIPVVYIDFNGAADAKYTVAVPLDGSAIPTNNVLSVSTLVSTYVDLPYCKFHAVDVEPALSKIAENTWAVGPPQTINSVQCWQYHTV